MMKLSFVEREIIHDKSGGDCWYCGGRMTKDPEDPLGKTFDHQRPRSRGGDLKCHTNIVFAHRCCNREKGDMTLAEYRIFKGVQSFFGEGGSKYDPPIQRELVAS